MSQRTHTRRAALCGAGAIVAIPSASPAASLDAELIALLAEAKALRETAPRRDPRSMSMAHFLAPQPWEAVIVRACAIPARTPEGLRAKAEALRLWTESSTPQERIGLSLAADLLGGLGA